MTNYHARWEEPLQTNYREYQAYAPGLSTWGGVNNIEALNLLELANVKQSGPYTTAPQSLLWLMQIAECHKMTWTRHDLSEHDLSPKSRATKPTSAWVWEQMQNGKWPWLPEGVRRRANQANHSDGIVVVDQWGNMAVIGHTINTSLWGDTGIFVDGISIPDAASFQPRDIAQAGPGKRLPNGMNPAQWVAGCITRRCRCWSTFSISIWTRNPPWTHRLFSRTASRTEALTRKCWKASRSWE
jgi:gamma-glutamyltranspeptidase/glutathione hydrolase